MENLPEKRQADNFPAMLTKFKSEIERALPKHLNPDRICRIALTEFRKNPKLSKCDPRSVFAAVIQSAQLGLEVGLMGEAFLVPFKTECQLIPGYTGLMKLVTNTGKVKDIYAHEVRENDEFEIEFGLSRSLAHRPLKGKGGFPASDTDRGDVVGYYAVGTMVDGSSTFVAMSQDEVLKIRDNSKGYKAAKSFGKDSPWDTDPVEMGKKTVIRRLCKYLPKSPELAMALALDSATDVTGRQSLTVDDAINGTWAPDYDKDTIDVTPTAASSTVSDEFNAAAKTKFQGSDLPLLDEFIGLSVAHYNTNPETVKERALGNWKMFCESFETWKTKKYPTTTSPQDHPTTEQAQPAGDAANVPEKPAESPAPPADPWQEKRSRYINLKGPGYSTFVFQNKAMFEEMPAEQRMEAIEKWVKLYPGQPWPLNADTERKIEAAEPEKAPEQPQERPVSFTDEYKALMELKTKHPDVYAKARVELNIAPDTVLHCVTLKAAMEDVIRAMPGQDEPPVESYQPPTVSDTSGF